MKFIDFYNKFSNYPLISKQEVRKFYPELDPRRFYEWQKKGHIKKVINNFYVFSQKDLSRADFMFIANKIYEPSYISLELALSYYNFIPEAVFAYTSVTSRKTKNLNVELGNFYYKNIKEELFFGYTIITQNGISYKIAEPEKALLDFLYLRSDLKTINDLESLRINPFSYKEQINQKKLDRYLEYFNSATLKLKMKRLNKTL